MKYSHVLFIGYFQLATWFFTTFTASDIKKKVFSLKGVQFLYTKINPDQLDIPPFVLDYDIQVMTGDVFKGLNVESGVKVQNQSNLIELIYPLCMK